MAWDWNALLSYNTVKLVTIHNWKVGLLHYGIQIGIVCYILIWVIILNKGYQGEGDLVGNANVKPKGVASVDINGTNQIWDEHDVVFPAKEEGAIFLTTNFLATQGQSRSQCPSSLFCNASNPCPSGPAGEIGIYTGDCLDEKCMLNAWCPLEKDVVPDNYLEQVKDFTLFVKLNVLFPKYGISRDNTNGTVLTPNYNLFRIDDILKAADTSFDEIKSLGGLILANVRWECDLDRSASKCHPNFEFTRIDTSTKLSKGYNFRYVHYYWLPDENNTQGKTQYRDLYKVLGIRIIFLISGKGKKFDIIQLVLNIASGLALLSIATLMTDLIALYLLPKRKLYHHAKFQEVAVGEAEPLLDGTSNKNPQIVNTITDNP